MTVDYDLVIIGGSPAGIYAAIAATHLKARVALVLPDQPMTNWLGLRVLGNKASRWGTFPLEMPPLLDLDEDKQAKNWPSKISAPQFLVDNILATLAEEQSPAVLASLGIDVMAGIGQFCRKPQLAFEANNRVLRSRTYLLATGSRPVIPDIEGMEDNSTLFNEGLSRQWEAKTVIIIGGDPTGLELAQTLAQQGAKITLIVGSPHILPKEDSEAAFLVQAQLEAEGIHILTATKVTQVKKIEHKKWVQAGNKAIDADEIFWATGYQPNIESLNLERVGVELLHSESGHKFRLQLNEKLQTTNPRIYGCGAVAGGYMASHIATYEASIALKNALFLPIFKVDYRGIPWGIFTVPQLARVGFTESQARRCYGKDVLVFRQYFKSVAGAQLRRETTGFCKIIVRGNGEILGVHIVGPEARELIHCFALAMRQRMKVGAIASLPHLWPTLSEINQQTAKQWNHYRISRLENILESFFNWRRG